MEKQTFFCLRVWQRTPPTRTRADGKAITARSHLVVVVFAAAAAAVTSGGFRNGLVIK